MRSTLMPLLAPMEDSEMMISGVPPYVEIYRKIKAVYDKLTTFPEEFFCGVRRILDENTMAAGHITRAVLDEALRAIVASVRAEAQAASPTASEVYSAQEPSQRFGDGWLQYRRLPEAFELPRVNVAVAWRLWWCGNAAQHHPPYRNIAPYKLGAKKKRNMLVEWNNVMLKLIKHYEATMHRPIPKIASDVDATATFEFVKGALDLIMSKTPKDRERRTWQLQVPTIARLLRNLEKSGNAQATADIDCDD
ncbi:hypothetical protein ACHHYP_20574 [Achlya hypogyna]|uniref:Uncharacterized protein n=1 Tax=Achlya hypogyna TaxID=1202772 RepID=A0A1V9YIA8_ACHHY|nr:hypothetical protein ACHHYP_20574 [Achlya hypogyna]